MKNLLFTVLAVLPLAVFAQKQFHVKGNIKGLKAGDKIYLTYKADGIDVVDSVTVKNHVFKFKGQLTEPSKADLFLNKSPFADPPLPGEVIDHLPLYVEAARIKIRSQDSLKKARVSGSAIYTDDLKLKAMTKPVTDQLAAINAAYSKLSAEQKKDDNIVQPLTERYGKTVTGLFLVYLTYAKNNPASYVSLAAIGQLAGNPEHVTEAGEAFAILGPKLKASKAGKEMALFFASSKGTAIGSIAIDFMQNDVNDKPVKLSDFRGKYVLLDFWASWCGPCRGENPNVVKAFQAFKDKNFTVLGVSLDKPGEKNSWLAAIEKDGLTWTHVSDLKWWDNAVARQYNIHGIPANFLLDPAGKIIAKNIRGEELQKKLAEVLGAGAK